MNTNCLWRTVAHNLGEIQHQSIVFQDITAVSGGCINQTWKIEDSLGHYYFAKTNQASLVEMFAAEFTGLQVLGETQTIRVPKPICYGIADKTCYLLMEYIALRGRSHPHLAGRQLAALHQSSAENKLFGWFRDNTIGSTLQLNQQNADWVNFWGQQRLAFQFKLARKKGYATIAYEQGLRLIDHLATFFQNYRPDISLLHGDLWSGNIAYDEKHQPVIFDPAVYYGDREADLAMTELFGGFGANFYAAYDEQYPIDRGYAVRKTLYNLYHILNHFNLFGGGYGHQAKNMTERLLAEL